MISLKPVSSEEIIVCKPSSDRLFFEALHRLSINRLIAKKEAKAVLENDEMMQLLVAMAISDTAINENSNPCTYFFPVCSQLSMLTSVDFFRGLPSVFEKIFVIFTDKEKNNAKGVDLQCVSREAKKAFYELLESGGINSFIKDIYFSSDCVNSCNACNDTKIYRAVNDIDNGLDSSVFEDPLYRYLISSCLSEGFANIKLFGYNQAQIVSSHWLERLQSIFSDVFLIGNGEKDWISTGLLVSGLEKINNNISFNDNSTHSSFGHFGT